MRPQPTATTATTHGRTGHVDATRTRRIVPLAAARVMSSQSPRDTATLSLEGPQGPNTDGDGEDERTAVSLHLYAPRSAAQSSRETAALSLEGPQGPTTDGDGEDDRTAMSLHSHAPRSAAQSPHNTAALSLEGPPGPTTDCDGEDVWRWRWRW